jgi:hypothetical protein
VHGAGPQFELLLITQLFQQPERLVFPPQMPNQNI